MTDYRVGYKSDARHWLAVASAIVQEVPGSLPEDWAKRMDDSLKELNEEVYAVGVQALSSDAPAKSRSTEDAPAADTDSPGVAPREKASKQDKED